MLLIRGCHNRNGRTNPQRLKKAVTCDLGYFARPATLTMDKVSTPKELPGGDITGRSIGVKIMPSGWFVFEHLESDGHVLTALINGPWDTEQLAETAADLILHPQPAYCRKAA